MDFRERMSRRRFLEARLASLFIPRSRAIRSTSCRSAALFNRPD
ncbi:MAG: hypothetical protein WDZ37_02585 [Solirubrobacterales bacterium]